MTIGYIKNGEKMKFEDIANNKTQELVKYFYAYQRILLTTQVGITINEEPQYPVYFNGFVDKVDKIKDELFKFGIKAKEVVPLEKVNSSPGTSFSVSTQAYKYLLLQDNDVIEPPTNIDLVVKYIITRLDTPYR